MLWWIDIDNWWLLLCWDFINTWRSIIHSISHSTVCIVTNITCLSKIQWQHLNSSRKVVYNSKTHPDKQFEAGFRISGWWLTRRRSRSLTGSYFLLHVSCFNKSFNKAFIWFLHRMICKVFLASISCFGFLTVSREHLQIHKVSAHNAFIAENIVRTWNRRCKKQ